MGFQKTVNSQPGVGQVGDFADANLRTVVNAGPGGFVASAARPPIVGHFAWGDQNPAGGAAAEVSGQAGIATGGQLLGSYQGEATTEVGFVAGRAVNTVISAFLAEASLVLAPGFIATIFNEGGFWAAFAAGATPGQKVFAKYIDGEPVAAATGTSTQTASVTASLANTGVLTVSAVGSGAVHVGDVGTDAAGHTYAIVSQLSGTANGVGTYQTTLAGVTQGGGTVTFADRVETAFYVTSPALAGELAKISTWG